MPARVNPRDWDRLFKPGAPRRGGPLRAFANLLILAVVLTLLGGGAFFGLQYIGEQGQRTQAANEAKRATNLAQSTITLATRTAEVATGTARAIETMTARPTRTQRKTPTAATPLPPLPAQIGGGRVVQAGNLRSEPRFDPATVVAQLCINDEVSLLEKRSIGTAVWYHLQVKKIGDTCVANRAAVGTEGWVSASLIATP